MSRRWRRPVPRGSSLYGPFATQRTQNALPASCEERWTTRPAPLRPSRQGRRMASRERKRTERQKRKARSSERRAEVAARYEERNQAAREALEPLTPTERPVVVTVGAV